MAANISRTGFWPWMNVGSTSTQLIRRRTASNNGTAIFLGDALKRTAAGVWGLATAGAGISGFSGGCSFFDSNINGRREQKFLPASTTYSGTTFDDHGETDNSFLYVVADPVSVRYVGQYSASTMALTDLTKNANFAAGSGGSTTTGISSHVIDQTTLATTANLDLSIVDFQHNVFNDVNLTTAAVAKAIVQINVGLVPPFNSAGTAGV